MDETITILVENFNIKELKYEFGKQDIDKVNFHSLKNILKELPFGKDVLIPPRVITNKLIFERMGDDLYWYQYNDSSSYFMNRDNDYQRKTRFLFGLEDLDRFFKEKEELSLLKKVSSVFLGALDSIWFLYVILNIIFFIGILTQEFNNPNVNIVFVIFLIWINVFCIYSLGFGIYKLIKLKREPQRIKLVFSLPFINSFETLDVSETIIVFGQFFLNGFTFIYENRLSIVGIISIVFIGIILSMILIRFINEYTYNNKSKDSILQRLLFIIHNHLEEEEKQTYLQVSMILENKPLLSSEKVPKFFTLFSLLLTFIPIISYLFIYG